MTSNVKFRPASRGFYGWYALAGANLVIFSVSGVFSYSYGIFLPVICHEFGWSRASVGAGMSIGYLAFGLPSPFFGMMVARFGPRFNLILGNTLAALGLAGMFFVREVWHIYLLYGFIGLTAGIGGYIAGSAIANNWFVKKRPLAMGVFNACSGLGGFVFAPVTRALISSIGWRLSWVVLGGIVLIVASLIGSLILIRNKPEDMGQHPDGSSDAQFVAAAAIALSNGASIVAWRSSQALRMPTIWLLAGFAATGAFIMGTMNTHQVAYLQDIGFTPMTAAMTMSIVAVSVVIGSLLLGISALRINIRYLASTGIAIQVIALGILLSTHNLNLIYVYSILIGLGHGAVIAALPIFVSTYFVRDHYAWALGLIMLFQFILQASAATVAGAIHDITGAYTWAFIIVITLGIIGLICAFTVHRPESQPSRQAI